jgi:class 3 adenylate cyclase
VTEQPRYDEGTLRKVTALAARLQSQKQETLTAREIEAVGAEVGLEIPFIRQALAQIASRRPRLRAAEGHRSKTEFRSVLLAWGGALLWGALAYLPWTYTGLTTFFAFSSPVPLALLLGYTAGQRRAGFMAGLALAVALAPTLYRLSFAFNLARSHDEPWARDMALVYSFWYVIGGGLLAGLLGWQGARLREQSLPAAPTRPTVSRQDLSGLLFALQSQLEGEKRHRAFLSMDVVGSSAMKREAPGLAVEHSFGQCREWVAQAVHHHGGEMHSATGHGVMAIFPTDASAVRAARQLLEELPRFNQEQNRLPTPFQLRCGISAGDIAIEEGTPLGHLHSPVIDRAAALQKQAEPGSLVVSGEVAAAALVELGNLASLPEPVAGEPAFVWQPAPTRA